MKKLVLVGILGLVGTASADEVEPAHRILGVDAAVVVPMGDYGEVADIGAGALARLEFPMGQGFVYGRAGVIVHKIDERWDGGSLTFVPIYAGYRYPLNASGAYLAGEVGITVGYATVDTGFGTASDSDTELGVMLSAGMRRGSLDLRGGLFLPDVDDAMGLMASAGLDFSKF